MDEKEFAKYLNVLKKDKREIVSSPEKSKKFLIDIGILTPTGRMSKKYKERLKESEAYNKKTTK